MKYDTYMRHLNAPVAKAEDASAPRRPTTPFGEDNVDAQRGSRHADMSALEARGWTQGKEPAAGGGVSHTHPSAPGHKIEVGESGSDHLDPKGKVTHVKPGELGKYLTSAQAKSAFGWAVVKAWDLVAAEKVEKYITHEGGKYRVHAESGRVLGTHDSKADALAQLRAVEFHKHNPTQKAWSDEARQAALEARRRNAQGGSGQGKVNRKIHAHLTANGWKMLDPKTHQGSGGETVYEHPEHGIVEVGAANDVAWHTPEGKVEIGIKKVPTKKSWSDEATEPGEQLVYNPTPSEPIGPRVLCEDEDQVDAAMHEVDEETFSVYVDKDAYSPETDDVVSSDCDDDWVELEKAWTDEAREAALEARRRSSRGNREREDNYWYGGDRKRLDPQMRNRIDFVRTVRDRYGDAVADQASAILGVPTHRDRFMGNHDPRTPARLGEQNSNALRLISDHAKRLGLKKLPERIDRHLAGRRGLLRDDRLDG